jgi:hypothetical protein
MLHRARFAFFALLSAGLVGPEFARAQTVSPSGQAHPDRYVHGNFLGPSTRPQNLMPLGINYSDCTQDMVLRFNVVVSGFTGSQSMQVWASKSSNCADSTARGVGANAVITCWLVNQGFAGDIIGSATTRTFDVRVQDLVGAQNAPPNPANYVQQGPDACTAQSTFVAVPINIFFLPLDSSLNSTGTSYQYSITTDLVGPPAPANVLPGIGDTFLGVTWTPNSDADTTGYDVFLDPLPGQEYAAAVPVQVCPDAGVVASPQDADLESGDDGSASGATGSSADVCTSMFVGNSNSCPLPPMSVCASGALTGAIVQDGGTVIETDDAGNPIEGGAVSRSGGLSTIPSSYLFGAGPSGVTVADKNTGTYTIANLKNDVAYTVVVAAVDGSGNVGPPSVEACQCPSRVNDFWNLYRQGGGQAGGGCALESVGEPVSAVSGVALIAATSALARRRRRNRRGERNQ